MKISTHLRISRLRMHVFLIFVMSILALSSHGEDKREDKRVVNLSPARELPFNDGIVAGNTLYVAGQEGTENSSKLVAGGIGSETKTALENIQKVLKAAGFDLKDIVSVTVYLADIHEFADMNKVYTSLMPDPKPARATIQAAALVNDARIEISAIAVKGK